jgi:hypothetical protein
MALAVSATIASTEVKTRQRGAFTVAIENILTRDLAEAGVDLDRVAFITWGQETSSNRFRNFENIILAGVLQRSDGDLVGAMLGQTFDLLAEVDQDKLSAARISESVHCAFQAICRTRCRKMQDGRSLPVTAWIFYHNPAKLREGLNKVMPGIRWERWKNVALPADQSKRHDLVRQVSAYLLFKPETVTEVTCRTVRADLGLVKEPRNTFVRATDEALASVPWARRGQRLVRVTTA